MIFLKPTTLNLKPTTFYVLKAQRGVSLIDTIIASALMLMVFMGIATAFQLSVDVVSNNKARAGAIALANERMEYVRSLTYTAVGTVGGIPTGTIPQSESITLNNVTYTRRAFIAYEDDPMDGTGLSDTNAVVEDYKSVKVDVSWRARTGIRHITLMTRITPAAGYESAVPGGVLSIIAINARGTPIQGASVSIVNTTSVPAVNINTFTDNTGTATILGAPAASGYRIVVTQSGYSTAQTYSTTAENTNPNPGNLTVSNNRTTTSTFAIDVLGSKTVQTWTPIVSATWTDTFADSSKVSTSTNITVSSGTAKLSGSAPYVSPGEVQSIAITPSNLTTWTSLTVTQSLPGSTSMLYRIYDGSGATLVPDAQLPGNSGGFAGGTINLSGVSTSTYPSLRLDATFSTTNASSTPSLDAWTVAYTYGPVPLPNIAFTVQGAKTIGSGSSGTLYKYSSTQTSGSLAVVVIPGLEWDTYTIVVPSSSGYDVVSACNPQPEALSPGSSLTSNLYLSQHTTNSLLIDIRAAATGNLIPGAMVSLSKSGFIATSTTDQCGQSFFSNISASNAYSISVTAPGQASYSATNISVSGTTRKSVQMN